MLHAILAVLALFVIQTLLPAAFRYLLAGPGTAVRLRIALGSRDEQPPSSVMGRRAERALANVHEALLVFLALALLHMFRGTDAVVALQGAWLFALARMLYVPAYLAGIFGLRSAIWVLSWIGLAQMIAALFIK